MLMIYLKLLIPVYSAETSLYKWILLKNMFFQNTDIMMMLPLTDFCVSLLSYTILLELRRWTGAYCGPSMRSILQEPQSFSSKKNHTQDKKNKELNCKTASENGSTNIF